MSASYQAYLYREQEPDSNSLLPTKRTAAICAKLSLIKNKYMIEKLIELHRQAAHVLEVRSLLTKEEDYDGKQEAIRHFTKKYTEVMERITEIHDTNNF